MSKNFMVIIVFFLVVMNTCICSGNSDLPQDGAEINFTSSEYFETESVLFNLDPDSAGLICTINLTMTKEIKRAVFIETQFKNTRTDELLPMVDKFIEPDQRYISINSPLIYESTEGDNYEIVVLVYEDSRKGRLISQHAQEVRLGRYSISDFDISVFYVLVGNITNAAEIFERILAEKKMPDIYVKHAGRSLTLLDNLENNTVVKEYVDYFFKGLIYFLRRDFNKAIPEFKKATEVNSSHPLALSYLGHSYLSFKKYKEAISIYDKCIKMNIGYPDVFWGIAEAYRLSNEPQEEKEYLQKARELFQQENNDSAVEKIEKRLLELNKE